MLVNAALNSSSSCVEAAEFSGTFLTINFKQRILLESVCLVGTTTW